MLRIRTAHLADAPALYATYQNSPDYFARLGTALPTAREVEFELGLALMDPRRHVELIELVELPVGTREDAQTGDGTEAGGSAAAGGNQVIGLLDWKEAYPEPSDVTINLLLLSPEYRGAGLGTQVMRDLERRAPGSATRLMASVLGEHPTGVSFWEKLGYAFAIDARPAMTWYAKPLTGPLKEKGARASLTFYRPSPSPSA